ncbi:MAG: DeoR/GlpR transcriptional regulator [Oscillospiraceae bacterium]|nr:DeoR/GlpR transcriptional regulator [Oscillospiraceae bacterium]
MTKQFRWRLITETLNERQTVTVDELVDILMVSPATVRRDLQEMEDLRMITRFHGGARISTGQIEEPHMIIKSELNQKEKRAIAVRAARLISDDQMVFLDAGSSTFEMIQYITAKNITVVTPGIPHLTALYQRDIPTIALGGPIRPGTQAIAGRQTVEMIESMFFDVAFIGVNGIHDKIGFTTSNESEAATKESAIRRSTIPYVLADSSKFNHLSPFAFGKLSDAVIVTTSVPDSFIEAGARYILTGGRNGNA